MSEEYTAPIEVAHLREAVREVNRLSNELARVGIFVELNVTEVPHSLDIRSGVAGRHTEQLSIRVSLAL